MALLGTTSVYRVAGEDGDHVVLEALDVPGLEPGLQVRVTRAAAAAMELVGASSARPGGASADAA
jgi:hypothetical protein